MKDALKSVPGVADAEVPQGDGDGPVTPLMSGGVWKRFQITNFTVPINISFTKDALKSVPGVADTGVPQGDGDGSVTPP